MHALHNSTILYSILIYPVHALLTSFFAYLSTVCITLLLDELYVTTLTVKAEFSISDPTKCKESTCILYKNSTGKCNSTNKYY